MPPYIKGNRGGGFSRVRGRGEQGRGGGGPNRRGGGGGSYLYGPGKDRSHNGHNQNHGHGQHGERGRGVPVPALINTTLALLFEKHMGVLYNPENGFLNLAELSKALDLAAVKAMVDFNNVAFCKSVVAAIKQSPIGIPRFIDISANNIHTLHFFLKALADEGMQDGVIGLCANNNQIKDLGFLGHLKGFQQLSDLALQNNPCQNENTYVTTVTRRLPQLTFLDGGGILRHGLALPYPKRPDLSPLAVEVFQNLETAYLQPMIRNDSALLMNMLHHDAVFSMTKIKSFDMQGKAANLAVRRDLQDLKHTINDRVRNIEMNKIHRTVHGRTQVAAEFESSLFNVKFVKDQQLCGAANLQLFEYTPVPFAVATIHGRLSWLPKSGGNPNEEQPQHAYFDRTISLIHNGSWLITSDMIALRPCAGDEALLFKDAPSRIARIAARHQLPVELVAALMANAENDGELSKFTGLPKHIIDEALYAAAGSPEGAGRILKMCLIENCSVANAAQRLA